MSTFHIYSLARNKTSQMIEVYITDDVGKPVSGIVPTDVSVSRFQIGKSEAIAAANAIVGDADPATYQDNKFVEVDAVNKPGLYKYSIPNYLLALAGEQVSLIFNPSLPADANPSVIAINLSQEVVIASNGFTKLIVENGDTVGPIDALQALRGIAAVLMGTLVGADTPELTFRGVDTAIDRVVMTTDTYYNRTFVQVTL